MPHWLTWKDVLRIVQNGARVDCSEDTRRNLPIVLEVAKLRYKEYLDQCEPGWRDRDEIQEPEPEFPDFKEPDDDPLARGRKDMEFKLLEDANFKLDKIADQLVEIGELVVNLNFKMENFIPIIGAVVDNTDNSKEMITNLSFNMESGIRDILNAIQDCCNSIKTQMDDFSGGSSGGGGSSVGF